MRLSGEGGEGTLSLSAFIFKKLGSGDRTGAPNFPPNDLATSSFKFSQIEFTPMRKSWERRLPRDQEEAANLFEMAVPGNQDLL